MKKEIKIILIILIVLLIIGVIIMTMGMGSFAGKVVATVVVALDGTGDTTDIQEGINLLPAAGGAVYVREGTYNIDVQITINRSNVSIFGAGRSTILDGANGITIFYTNGENYLSIRDLYFSSQFGVQAANGIWLEDSIGSFIESCWIDDISGIGVALVGTTTGTTVRNCHIFPGTVGVALVGSDGMIENCYIDGAESGIAAVPFTNRYRFIGNIIINSTVTGIVGEEYNDCSFTANYIGDSTNDGVQIIDSSRNTFTGNNIIRNGDDGIQIFGASADNVIVGNVLRFNAGLPINDGGIDTEIGHNPI